MAALILHVYNYLYAAAIVELHGGRIVSMDASNNAVTLSALSAEEQRAERWVYEGQRRWATMLAFFHRTLARP
jgi:hypothetical protein